MKEEERIKSCWKVKDVKLFRYNVADIGNAFMRFIKALTLVYLDINFNHPLL